MRKTLGWEPSTKKNYVTLNFHSLSLFLVILVFELRALSLLSTFFTLVIFQVESLSFAWGWPQTLSSWCHRHIVPHLA
jgi:hypothetical protein